MMSIKDLLGNYMPIMLGAFLCSIMLTPVIRTVCRKNHWVDVPTLPRKIHSIPTPRLGGIVIYVAFFLPLLLLFFSDGLGYEMVIGNFDALTYIYIGSTLVFLLGVYDDIRGATVTQKLIVQCLAAMIIYFGGFQIDVVAVPFVGSVPLGPLTFPITILWVVGVTNALNFIDGIDGLACGVGFFSVSTVFIVSLYLHHLLVSFCAAALAGGLLGFAFYNFAPASIFMGDSGSLFIGFIIATISLHSSQKSSTAVVLIIPLVALGVPIADTLLAIIRRVGRGNSPFLADKDHIHHRLLRMGFSSQQVTLVLYGVCILLGVTALSMTAVNNQGLALILLMLSVMMIGGLKMLGYTADMVQINSLAKERIQKRKQLVQRQKFAEHILIEITSAVDTQTLQKAIIKYFENMELDIGCVEGVLLSAENRRGRRQAVHHVEQSLNFRWYSPRYERQEVPVKNVWTVTFPLMLNEQVYGHFLTGKYSPDDNALLDDLFLINSLRHSIEGTLVRLTAIQL